MNQRTDALAPRQRAGYASRTISIRPLLACSILMLACTALTACGGPAQPPRDSAIADDVRAAEPPATINPFTLDVWLYQRVEVVRRDGSSVDVTTRILDRFPLDGIAPLAMRNDFLLYPLVDFKAYLRDGDGNRRHDVAVEAGVLKNGNDRALAVFAIPDAGAEAPIGPGDIVFLDLSFLGEDIAVGDFATVDYYFEQAWASRDTRESGLSPIALYRQREAAGNTQVLAGADDAPIAMVQQVARVMAGSTGVGAPGKADGKLRDLFSGFDKCPGKSPAGCVRAYFKGAKNTARDVAEELDCNASFVGCDEPPPSQPRPPSRPAPPKKGHAWGDPHLVTLDGTYYDMQGVGEYTLVEALDFEVQIRTRPITDTVSLLSAVAIRSGNDRIMLGDGKLLVNGQRVAGAALSEPMSLAHMTLRLHGQTIEVSTAQGHAVSAGRIDRDWLQIGVGIADDTQGVRGLLGNFDGDPDNDFQSRDGRTWDAVPAFEPLHREFAHSWRVDDESSLFVYADGESTATFTDTAYPKAGIALGDAERRFTEAACRAAGVANPVAFDACVIDFALTDDERMVSDAVFISLALDAISGPLATGTSPDTGVAAPEAALAPQAAWEVSGMQLWERDGANRDPIRFHCPAHPPARELGAHSRLWGTGTYTDDSAICQAAWHAGIITPERGGWILVRYASRPEGGYVASMQDGIRSRGHSGGWRHAMQVSDVPGD